MFKSLKKNVSLSLQESRGLVENQHIKTVSDCSSRSMSRFRGLLKVQRNVITLNTAARMLLFKVKLNHHCSSTQNPPLASHLWVKTKVLLGPVSPWVTHSLIPLSHPWLLSFLITPFQPHWLPRYSWNMARYTPTYGFLYLLFPLF